MQCWASNNTATREERRPVRLHQFFVRREALLAAYWWQKLKLTWTSAAGRLMKIHLLQVACVKPLVQFQDRLYQFLSFATDSRRFQIKSWKLPFLDFKDCLPNLGSPTIVISTGHGLLFQLLKSPYLSNVCRVRYKKYLHCRAPGNWAGGWKDVNQVWDKITKGERARLPCH